MFFDDFHTVTIKGTDHSSHGAQMAECKQRNITKLNGKYLSLGFPEAEIVSHG